MKKGKVPGSLSVGPTAHSRTSRAFELSSIHFSSARLRADFRIYREMVSHLARQRPKWEARSGHALARPVLTVLSSCRGSSGFSWVRLIRVFRTQAKPSHLCDSDHQNRPVLQVITGTEELPENARATEVLQAAEPSYGLVLPSSP